QTRQESQPPATAGLPMVPAVLASIPQMHPAPKPRRGPWLWAVGAVLAAGVAGLLYFQPWAEPTAVVVVETATLGPVTRVLAVNGRIAGVRSVTIRPQIAGTLSEVLVADGEIVRVGTTLARIDPEAQQAVVRQALAGLDAALVTQAESEANYERTKALGANAARVVLESAARAVQSAAQEVARTTAFLDQAQIQLQKYSITAPLSGSVLALAAEPGQIVDLSTVLMTVADLGQLVVETDVDESYARQIKVGQPAALQLSGDTAVLDGHVSFVSQRVDETTGGLAIKLTPDAPLTAPIGLTVTANITVDDRASAITVPRAAIVRNISGDGVLVVTDGKAQLRPVQVIDWPAARLIVTDGLAAGDVVISDAVGLADGQTVKVAP
ncbi:MAG: efflux RND transporter periplasmic adaptor subunit, partial [Gemmobacter sp.]|nr:efflux RND transporter periplasmic adaptor subunit [Gemmobacter sp.]